MNKEELRNKCLELDFNESHQDRLDSFSKNYNNFYLLIAERKDGLFDAFIYVDGVEIQLPVITSVDWIQEFDECNEA